jgi:hypothetical protein
MVVRPQCIREDHCRFTRVFGGQEGGYRRHMFISAHCCTACPPSSSPPPSPRSSTPSTVACQSSTSLGGSARASRSRELQSYLACVSSSAWAPRCRPTPLFSLTCTRRQRTSLPSQMMSDSWVGTHVQAETPPNLMRVQPEHSSILLQAAFLFFGWRSLLEASVSDDGL